MVKWLKKRLILYIASLFLILLMLVMFILYIAIEDTLYDNAKESAFSIANSIYIALDDTVFNSAQLVTLIGHDPYVIHNLFSDETKEAVQLKAYLCNISNVYNFDLYIGSFKSNHYYSKEGLIKTFSKNIPEDQWFFELAKTNSGVSGYQPLISKSQGIITLNNLQYINDADGKRQGFVLNSIDYTKSLSKIKDSIKALDATVYVMNPDGTSINLLLNSLNDDSLPSKPLDFLEIPKIVSNNSSNFIQVVKNKTSITYKYIHEIDSYLVITQDLKSSIFYTFIITLLIVVFILACILLIILKLLNYSNNKIYHEASLDPLTQVFNRSVFNAKLNEAIELCAHYNIISSLIFIDIDNFKIINDEMGHPMGDEIIQRVAKLLEESKRKNDILFRWGGDEFGLIVRSNLENAVQLSERILVNAGSVLWKENTPITFSIGVTEILCQDNKKLVFQRVDQALYEAKTNGKNQVCYK